MQILKDHQAEPMDRGIEKEIESYIKKRTRTYMSARH
jgi:trimethylamine:corrinoid methyltransferase-like protein